jgi:hypothetical protein
MGKAQEFEAGAVRWSGLRSVELRIEDRHEPTADSATKTTDANFPEPTSIGAHLVFRNGRDVNLERAAAFARTDNVWPRHARFRLDGVLEGATGGHEEREQRQDGFPRHCAQCSRIERSAVHFIAAVQPLQLLLERYEVPYDIVATV